MAVNNVTNCSACTKIYPIRKPDANCKNVKEEICDIRVVCQDELSEVVSPSETLNCAKGYISDIAVDPASVAQPMVAVDILNAEDVDELLDYSFDEDTDEGTEVYSFGPMKIKIYNPDQECAMLSWQGRNICVYYRILNRDGDYCWRRVCGRLSTITGGLIAGYELTIVATDASDETRPCFVNMGGCEATTAALDLITTFG